MASGHLIPEITAAQGHPMSRSLVKDIEITNPTATSALVAGPDDGDTELPGKPPTVSEGRDRGDGRRR